MDIASGYSFFVETFIASGYSFFVQTFIFPMLGFDVTLGYPGEGPNNLDVRATLGGTVKVIKTRLQKLELSLDNVQTLITAETKDENRKGVLRLLNVLSRKIQRKLNSAERKKKRKKDRHINPTQDRHINPTQDRHINPTQDRHV